jgi:hypothetical protein
MRRALFYGTAFCALALATGCNVVLGIERPSDEVTDTNSASVLTYDACVASTDTEVDPIADRDAGAQSEAGVSLMAVPHAWAAWPMPNSGGASLPNPPTYLKEVEGVVTDAVTQLQWQRDVDSAALSWSDASRYCTELKLAGGKFRLPTRIELLSVVDDTANRPTIDADAFPNTPAAKFWSASPFAGDAESAWLVNFDFGTGFVFAGAMDEKHRVRCVR